MERKDAIEKIKEAMPTLWKDTKEALETLIPELQENKDEKIRKSLIKYFRNYYEMYDKSCGEPKWGSDYLLVKDILAWLEMRKEQKTLSTEETELNSLAFLEQMGYTCIPPGKEQKPAEWSEEDEIMIDNIEQFLSDPSLKKLAPNTEKQTLNWLKSLPERFNLQSKQEWSEEDRIMLNTIIADVSRTLHSCGIGTDEHQIRSKAINFLKSLRPQPKQEWNKEDEKIVYSAYCWLSEYAGYLVDKDSEKSSMLYGIANKLKSLRPQPHTVSIKDATKFGNLEYERGVKDGIQSEKSRQWKPSEEQIAELKRVSSGGTCAFNPEILRSLYNDLVENYKTK